MASRAPEKRVRISNFDPRFDRILSERYPDGWEAMLMDAGVLFAACNAIMKSRAHV